MNTQIARAIRLVLAVSSGALATYAGPTFAQAAESAPAAAAPAESSAASGPKIEEVVVVGRQRSAVTDVVEERINQEVVADFLGTEQIGRVGDSSVSLALRRLPGVTLVSDQYIYVRGLGERYSSTTLNGAYVPSPDLSRNVIPLDIFPAAIIDSLAVSKGYSANMPAAFGGGNVDIRTRSIPNEPVLSLEIGSGWNSESSDDALTYDGGSDDWFGSDDGTREMPSAIRDAVNMYQGDISAANILTGLRRDGQNHTIAEAQAVNRDLALSLNRDIDIREESADPDISAEAVAGNSWDFGERWRFGVLGLADYGSQTRTRDRVNRSAQFPDVTVTRTRQSTQQVNLTGSLNLGLQYGDDHKIELSGLYLRNTDDETSIARRNNNNFALADGIGLRDYRLRYEERNLELAQVRGTHKLGDDTLDLLGSWASFLGFARDLTFTWYYSDATAETDIPNEVNVSAEDRLDPSTGALISTSLRASTSSAEYRFTELQDEVRSYGWELSKPWQFGNWNVEFAGGYERYEKGRGYLQTLLQLGTQALGTDQVRAGTPGQVLTDANILDPTNAFQLALVGTDTDSYLAAEIINAGYGKFDINWNETWRLAGGVRFEDFSRIAVPVDPLQFDVNVGKIPVPVDQLSSLATTEDDYYPTLALTYKRNDFWAEDFQLRFGASMTTARPDLREIANATYIDPLTDARVRGNPDLINSELTNFDVRAEWFFANGDNFTVSTFYKDISDPIETVQGAGSDDIVALSFINADSAEVYGVEVEWFKVDPFGQLLGVWADDLFVTGNVTASDSEITVGSQASNVTNDKRGLTQHSEYVGNVQLGYDAPNGKHAATIVYNVFGKRVYFAGINGAPDAYEQPFNSLDLTYSFYPTEHFTVKLRLQNLLDEQLEIEQAGVVVLEQEVGTTVKLDAQMKF